MDRENCKIHIESLENWLRRLIDETLTDKIGPDYFTAFRDDGSKYISNGIARPILARRASDLIRYPRDIDAAMLDDEISIVCNAALYSEYFSDALGNAFDDSHKPTASWVLRAHMERLIGTRNKLYHANELSALESSRAVCYSMDIIESIKSYYTRMNVGNEYNAPEILVANDSFGVVTRQADTIFAGDVRIRDFTKIPSSYLYPGDRLRIEVEADPTFDQSCIELSWQVAGRQLAVGNVFDHVLRECDVNQMQGIFVTLVYSKNGWHRYGTHDDKWILSYKVLPVRQ